MKTFFILTLVVLFLGCANGFPKVSQIHQQKLQELDAQYKAGQIDAVQYQAKYSEEVQNYNAKRMMGSGLIHHMKYKE